MKKANLMHPGGTCFIHFSVFCLPQFLLFFCFCFLFFFLHRSLSLSYVCLCLCLLSDSVICSLCSKVAPPVVDNFPREKRYEVNPLNIDFRYFFCIAILKERKRHLLETNQESVKKFEIYCYSNRSSLDKQRA